MLIFILILLLFFIVLAYVLGSVNSAILVCKFMRLPDPRTEGSKNPGTTNVLRLGGKKAAIITLIGDVLKGFIPVVLGHLVGFTGFDLALIALAAFLGHVYPVFFNYQGGKGVATALGAMLALSWPVALAAVITWGIVAYISRYSSLAALIATISLPIYIWIFSNPGYLLPVLVMCIIIIVRHRANIQRLRAGTETKIGKKHV